MKQITTLFNIISLSTASFSLGNSTVTYDFESEDLNDIFRDGEVSGWSQNIPNPPNLNFFGTIVERPIAYIQDTSLDSTGTSFMFGAGPTKAGYIGNRRGYKVDGSTTTVTTSFDTSSLTPSIPRVMVNLGIFEPSENFTEGRADFDFEIIDASGTSIASVGFVQSLQFEGDWNVSVSSRNSPVSVLAARVQPQVGYTFTIDFEDEGTVFSYEPSDGSGSSTFLSAQPAVADYGARVNGIRVSHIPGAINDRDVTTMMFDDIIVSVPEPSSSVFVFAGCILLVRRRRP